MQLQRVGGLGAGGRWPEQCPPESLVGWGQAAAAWRTLPPVILLLDIWHLCRGTVPLSGV